MKLFLNIILVVLATIDIASIVDYLLDGRYEVMKLAYCEVMTELGAHYLCGHSLFKMIDNKFFPRFGHFNHEGFCYTISAAIALSLKNEHTTRIVRGYIKQGNFASNHSWVEVKILGHWWVVDPCFFEMGFIGRCYYYLHEKPKVLAVYRYDKIWQDPLAERFHERLSRPELSRIFIDLYWHYTPDEGDIKIPNRNDADDEFLEKGLYYVFPPEYGYKFDQETVNDFMARPTRKSPRRRTLRRLEKFYKKLSAERQQTQTPV